MKIYQQLSYNYLFPTDLGCHYLLWHLKTQIIHFKTNSACHPSLHPTQDSNGGPLTAWSIGIQPWLPKNWNYDTYNRFGWHNTSWETARKYFSSQIPQNQSLVKLQMLCSHRISSRWTLQIQLISQYTSDKKDWTLKLELFLVTISMIIFCSSSCWSGSDIMWLKCWVKELASKTYLVAFLLHKYRKFKVEIYLL